MENISKLCTEDNGFVEKCNNLNCKNNATVMCQRCCEGYCSSGCQILDWRRHKQICQLMPKLVPYESPRSLAQRMFSQKVITNSESTVNYVFAEPASPILDVKTEAANNQSSPSIAAAQLGPKSDNKDKAVGAEPELQVKLSSLPTIGGKIEKEIELSVESLSIAATPVAASPSPILFGKEATQILGKASSVTAMPTISVKKEEVTQIKGQPLSMVEKQVAASPPIFFRKEAETAQGKATSTTAMPTISMKHEGVGQTQGKLVAASSQTLFGKKAAQLHGKSPLAKTQFPGSLKSIIWDKLDDVLTTKKAAPLDTAANSTEKQLITSEEWKTPFKSEFFKFLPFKIQHVNKNDPKIVWIIEERNLPHLEALKEHMQKYISEKQQPCCEESITDGRLLIAVHAKKQAYRVKVIQNSVQQKNVLVQAIDCGQKSFIDYSNLYEASPQAAGSKAFAFPVEIQGKSYGLINPEARIYMRLISMPKTEGEGRGVGGLIKAIIQYEPIEKLKQLLLLNGFEIKILKISDDERSALVQCPFNLNFITENLTKTMESRDLKTFTITEETFLVAAHTAEGWRRAVIIDSLPGGELHLIYVIDEGCLKVSDTLQCLPDNLAQLPSCAFIIFVNRFKDDLKKCQINNQLAKFEIRYDGSDKKLILYRNANKICQIYLKSYFDDAECGNKLAIKEINASGSYVYITKLINHAQVYINLADSKKYPGLFELLAPKCPKYMKERPTVQDIVLVKTCEEDYYRGEIILLSSDNGDIYDVLNIDTGKLHKSVHIETMFKPCAFIRYLPRHLQELSLTMLHTIPAETLPTTSAIWHQLNEYIKEGTLFKVEYPGNSFTEGNLLFSNRKGLGLSTELLPLLNRHVMEKPPYSAPTADSDVGQKSGGTLIGTIDDDSKQKLIHRESKNFQSNEDLFKSLPPSPPDSPPPGTKESDKENLMKLVTKKNTFQRFTFQDVPIKNIPTGQNIDIIILDLSNLQTCGYVCCTYFENQEEIDEFHDKMEIVHKYGQRTHKEIPENYLIGIDEICVALLKGDGRWYRAHCVSHDDDDMITIMFLDFGNIQQMHKSEILPITKDLLYPIYANFCYIDGYKPNEPNPEIDKYIAQQEKRLKCRRIITTGEQGYFLVKLDM